jgi:hypothetical protein
VPKVPTTPLRDRVVNLPNLPPEERWLDGTQSFRTSEQIFVCYGGQQKGKAAHWKVDSIVLAYQSQVHQIGSFDSECCFLLGVGVWRLSDKHM